VCVYTSWPSVPAACEKRDTAQHVGVIGADSGFQPNQAEQMTAGISGFVVSFLYTLRPPPLCPRRRPRHPILWVIPSPQQPAEAAARQIARASRCFRIFGLFATAAREYSSNWGHTGGVVVECTSRS
jgi:hypothetical protein